MKSDVRRPWTIALYFVLVAACAYGGTLLAAIATGRDAPPALGWLVKCVFVAVGVLAVTAWHMRRHGEGWRDYGVSPDAPVLGRAARGLLGGIALASGWAVVVWCWAPYRLAPNPQLTAPAFAMGVAATLAIGIAEETGYRGYGMRRLQEGYGAAAAVLLPTAIFVLAHVAGGVPWLAGLTVIGTASLLYGCLMLATRSLAFVAAFHIGNNLVQDAALRTSAGSLFVPVFADPGRAQAAGPAIWSSMAALNLAAALAALAWYRSRTGRFARSR